MMVNRSLPVVTSEDGARRRVLASVCAAHAVHDGLVALPYVLLPILATTFGLSLSQVGLLRSVSNLAMSILELPAGVLADRWGQRRLLFGGLLAAASGYLGVATANGFWSITTCMAFAGAAAAFQHSLSSSLLVQYYSGGGRRRALGVYNASGDAGKLLFTMLFNVALGAGLAWSMTVVLLALMTLVAAVMVAVWLRQAESLRAVQMPANDASMAASVPVAGWGILDRRRFVGLCAIVFLDSAVQASFLTFLPFLLIERGLSSSLAVGGVTLALTGGMLGKYVCGLLAARSGDRRAFLLVQLLTMLGLLATLKFPLPTLLVLLPLIGLVVQGSTTIGYGSIAEVVHSQRQARGYSLVYTVSAAASVVGPVSYGWLAELAEPSAAVMLLIGMVAATLCLAGSLQSASAEHA